MFNPSPFNAHNDDNSWVNQPDRCISMVEMLSAQGVRDGAIVELLQLLGFKRDEAVEIYRKGTMAWTLPGEFD